MSPHSTHEAKGSVLHRHTTTAAHHSSLPLHGPQRKPHREARRAPWWVGRVSKDDPHPNQAFPHFLSGGTARLPKPPVTAVAIQPTRGAAGELTVLTLRMVCSGATGQELAPHPTKQTKQTCPRNALPHHCAWENVPCSHRISNMSIST